MVLKRPILAAFIVLLSSALVVMVMLIIQQFKKVTIPVGLKYGIVFDAGASSTTVYVYNWPAEKENNTGVVSEKYKCESEGSAISDFDNEPAEAVHSIEQCLNRTIEVIPAEKHNATPLFLGATAGMRLLRIQNSVASTMILSAIENYLRSSPFDFKGAHIISGEEEGAYGWITANYLLGNFRQGRTWKQLNRPFTIMTKGTLDLGGASTEIAFVPKLQSHKYENTVITLYNHKYNVYIESLACYGRDEAENIYWANLIQKSANKSSIKDPCLPLHYTMTLQLEEVLRSSCIVAKLRDDYDADNNVTLIGTGDPALCRRQLLSIFNFTSSYVKGVWKERFVAINQLMHGEFVAFSGFYYTMEALNLTGSFSIDVFHSTVRSFCKKTWNQVQQLLPNMLESNRRAYCFNANYIYVLLVQGYKFNRLTWTHITFQEQVENNSIGWSLGYMLNLTNMIPAENQVTQAPMSEAAFCGILVLFLTLILFCSIFICISIIRSF
ncbi:ectonucleoside triphosphate diphosphohydrolase 3 [Pristis pectinata]|uniref:ectonucleoside triphosphate diphosphohydrolase 3 n=1 Tax=Pristis pectinata TaxID=685728 RepID=UPI00223C952C|nr:ectonucleoside triphosphate diphosphohydrolase 3 [Pristis pectinata]